MQDEHHRDSVPREVKQAGADDPGHAPSHARGGLRRTGAKSSQGSREQFRSAEAAWLQRARVECAHPAQWRTRARSVCHHRGWHSTTEIMGGHCGHADETLRKSDEWAAGDADTQAHIVHRLKVRSSRRQHGHSFGAVAGDGKVQRRETIGLQRGRKRRNNVNGSTEEGDAPAGTAPAAHSGFPPAAVLVEYFRDEGAPSFSRPCPPRVRGGTPRLRPALPT